MKHYTDIDIDILYKQPKLAVSLVDPQAEMVVVLAQWMVQPLLQPSPI